MLKITPPISHGLLSTLCTACLLHPPYFLSQRHFSGPVLLQMSLGLWLQGGKVHDGRAEERWQEHGGAEGSHLPAFELCWLAKELCLSVTSRLGPRYIQPYWDFHVCSWEFKSGPPACRQSTLTHWPFHQPRRGFNRTGDIAQLADCSSLHAWSPRFTS